MSLLPDDRMDVQSLVQALTNYVGAKTEHDKQRDAYEGYSWGYHGSDLVNSMDRAAVELGEYLDRYVDARVQKALADREAKSSD